MRQQLKMLKAQTAKIWEVRDANMPALYMFVSTHSSGFSKFVIINKNIMDDVFKELKDINIMLIEKNN